MTKRLDIFAKITGIKYKPFLCRDLPKHDIADIENAFDRNASFILKFDEEKMLALSWWVSAKRTRSYPYSRIYDTLDFAGKKVTVIPIFKDEGKEGDRDFLQWDTISLMSLLGVYAIVSYYKDAVPSEKYEHKITGQRFDRVHLKTELESLLSYQSDALHWNLAQINQVGELAEKALEAYSKISARLGIEMHSVESAERRVAELQKSKENFMQFSRSLAQSAQNRERLTVQPKEKLSGKKATLTIENYLGGSYFFTSDEAQITKNTIRLIEGKHTKAGSLPSTEDIKEGLIKMMLFTNLEDVVANGKSYKPRALLKLTSRRKFSLTALSKAQISVLSKLQQEASQNHFDVVVNGRNLATVRF